LDCGGHDAAFPDISSVVNLKFKTSMPRPLVGKIARLPHLIREQLNRRLRDGLPASEILSWLNHLACVKKILDALFSGAAISPGNLSNWRRLGYRRWLQDHQPIAGIEKRSRYGARISRAGRGIAPCAATLASDQLMAFLESRSGQTLTPDDLVKIATAIKPLLHAQQITARLRIEREKVRQKNEQLELERDKHQRDVAATALRVFDDAQAKAIHGAPCDHSLKIEVMGRHLFGKKWKYRPSSDPVPTTCSSLSPTGGEGQGEGAN
jgi:hypothetical protein